MIELAAITGGHVFVVQRADELRAAFAAVVSQFRSRYLLAYRPRGVESAGWHSIDVKLDARSRHCHRPARLREIAGASGSPHLPKPNAHRRRLASS